MRAQLERKCTHARTPSLNKAELWEKIEAETGFTVGNLEAIASIQHFGRQSRVAGRIDINANRSRIRASAARN